MKLLSFLRTTSLWILLLPVVLTITGAASNQLVLIANRDTFPVLVNDKKLQEMTAPEGSTEEPTSDAPKVHEVFSTMPAVEADNTVYLDDVHVVMTHSTHLNFLADVFDLRSIYSIGDFFIIAGSWLQGFALFVYVYAVTSKLSKLQS